MILIKRASLCFQSLRSSSLAQRFMFMDHGNIVRSRMTVDIPEITLYNYVMDKIDTHPPQNLAFVDPVASEEVTYAECIRRISQFTSVLRKQGFGKGDVLGIMSPNCVDYLPAVFGALGCQGIVSTINSSYTMEEMVYQLKDSGAKQLLVDAKNLPKALKAADVVGLNHIYVLGECSSEMSSITPWKRVLEEVPPDKPCRVDGNPKDVVYLPYSSGTTGLPKGVMLTNKNLVSTIQHGMIYIDDIPHTTAISVLPLFHIYAFAYIAILRLFKGVKIVTIPTFAPQTFLQALQQHKVESASLVPPLLLFLVNDPLVKTFDLSFTKEIATAAAPCSETLSKRVQETFPNAVMRQGYGLTETSPLIAVQLKDHIKHGSVGPLVPNTEAVIVDTESGARLGPGAVGELWCRGPQVMKGYLNRPDETRHCLTEDGWLKTGDLGYYDTDKHFYIVDRLKELIKYKGFQVAPAELEGLLIGHPDVEEAAVIGIPDEKAGELPKAFVKLRPKATLSENDLHRFLDQRVASHKKLRGGIEFVDNIPKSPSGKILRRLLKKGEKLP